MAVLLQSAHLPDHMAIASSSSSTLQETMRSFYPRRASPAPKASMPSRSPEPHPSWRVKSSEKALALVTACVNEPLLLSSFLTFLSWTDFVALTQTCKSCRDIFHLPHLFQVILSRYVEGYGRCLRDSELKSGMPQSMSVSFRDLDLFMISQSTPLTIYPTHALTILSSRHPHFHHDAQSLKLKALTQAHSRVILLIQFLAHSSSQPHLPEPESDNSTFSPYGSSPDITELRFPAPLSYSKEAGRDTSLVDDQSKPQPPRSIRQKSIKIKPLDSRNAVDTTPPCANPAVRPPTVKKRASIFRSNSRALPPPSEPKTLRHYGSGWRQSLSAASSRAKLPPSRGNSIDSMPDFTELPMPKFSSEYSSSCGSFSDLNKPLPNPVRPRSSHQRDSPPSSFIFNKASPRSYSVPTSPIPSPPSLLSVSPSPHDISLASSRVRAPIIRAYIPCGQIEISAERCEEQLIQSGLWDQLSVGDVICNLGYVPPTERADETTHWLLFNGDVLIPFSPEEDLLPLENPLTLPSPWYYEHIMPATMPSNVPLNLPGHRKFHSDHSELSEAATVVSRPVTLRMILHRIPARIAPTERPHMTLLSLTTTVKSPHSRGGYASVRRWAWIARFSVGTQHHEPIGKDDVAAGEGLGVGWQGEWILEGEGTKEGRQLLLDCISRVDAGERAWEFVRERSGGGKVWLRLL